MSTARCSRGTRTGFHETRGFMLPQDFSPGGFTARMLLAGSLMRGWGYLVGVEQGKGRGGGERCSATSVNALCEG